jgi:hypothetical protein
VEFHDTRGCGEERDGIDRLERPVPDLIAGVREYLVTVHRT